MPVRFLELMSLKYLPAIIEAAARSPLGLSALIIFMLGALNYGLFKGTLVETRVKIFVFTTIIFFTLFLIAIQTIPPVKEWSPVRGEPPELKLAPCDVVLFGPCSE